MRFPLMISCLCLLACGNEAAHEKTASVIAPDTNSLPSAVADTDLTIEKDTTSNPSYTIPQIESPSGIYQFLMPYKGTKVWHTIAFNARSYKLQEEYPGKKDSIVITEGTWAPSQGFIWLYKDQLVRGRYSWKGDTLQYFSPMSGQKFSMTKLIPVSNNAVWRTKGKEGALLFGVGTEPFWSIELRRKDSAILSMASWSQPLRVKLSATIKSKDSTVYISTADSLRITVYPYFCNDGMSDFTYPNKVTINHKGQVVNGCAMVF